jgi:magnesium transporter
LLRMMHDDARHKIREILRYPEESAGSMMRTDFIAIPNHYTADKVMQLIRHTKPSSEMMYRLYVVDERHKLLGVLTIRGLLLAQPDEIVTAFMKQKIIKIKVDATKDMMAQALSKYNLFVLPVVDELNMLKGVITADDILEEVIPKKWHKNRHRFKRTRIHRPEERSILDSKKELPADARSAGDGQVETK